MDLLPITAEDKLRELERELEMRRRVYPRANGYIAPAKQRQIDILEAIIKDYATPPGVYRCRLCGLDRIGPCSICKEPQK